MTSLFSSYQIESYNLLTLDYRLFREDKPSRPIRAKRYVERFFRDFKNYSTPQISSDHFENYLEGRDQLQLQFYDQKIKMDRRLPDVKEVKLINSSLNEAVGDFFEVLMVDYDLLLEEEEIAYEETGLFYVGNHRLHLRYDYAEFNNKLFVKEGFNPTGPALVYPIDFSQTYIDCRLSEGDILNPRGIKLCNFEDETKVYDIDLDAGELIIDGRKIKPFMMMRFNEPVHVRSTYDTYLMHISNPFLSEKEKRVESLIFEFCNHAPPKRNMLRVSSYYYGLYFDEIWLMIYMSIECVEDRIRYYSATELLFFFIKKLVYDLLSKDIGNGCGLIICEYISLPYRDLLMDVSDIHPYPNRKELVTSIQKHFDDQMIDYAYNKVKFNEGKFYIDSQGFRL